MKKIWLLVLLLAVGGFAFWRYYTSTPKYSLLQAYLASQNHDVAAFNRYVDVERLAGNLLDDVGGIDLPGLGSLGRMLPPGLSGTLKPMLSAQAKREVEEFIRSGTIRPVATPIGKISVLGAIGGTLGRAVDPSASFKGVAYEQHEAAGTALVGLEFTQPRYDTTVVVDLRLADRGDHWQVTELVRPNDLVERLGRLEKRRLLKRLN